MAKEKVLTAEELQALEERSRQKDDAHGRKEKKQQAADQKKRKADR